MKKFFLFLVLALFSVTAFSQGSIAQWKKQGNKTWFQDYKTYNGFGTTNPTNTWHFIGNVYSSTQVAAPLGVFTAITLNGTSLSTSLSMGLAEADSNANKGYVGYYTYTTQFALKLSKSDTSVNKGYVGWYTYNAAINQKAPLTNPSFGGKTEVPYATADSMSTKVLKLVTLVAADTAYKRQGIFLIGTGLYFGNGTHYLSVR